MSALTLPSLSSASTAATTSVNSAASSRETVSATALGAETSVTRSSGGPGASFGQHLKGAHQNQPAARSTNNAANSAVNNNRASTARTASNSSSSSAPTSRSTAQATGSQRTNAQASSTGPFTNTHTAKPAQPGERHQ